MKILVLSHMYPSRANEIAGIFVQEQVNALANKDVEIQVVCPIPWAPFPVSRISQKWKTYSEIPDQSVRGGIKVSYPRYLGFPRSWLFESSGRRMYRGIWKAVGRIHQSFSFDLIHAHVALPDGFAGALLTQRFGKPLIVTTHGHDLQHTIDRNTACQRAVMYAFTSASRIVLVSQKLRQLASNRLGIQDRLVVVPNGVDPQRVVVRPQELRDQQTRMPTLLSVSNLVQTKGIDLNLRAVKRIIGLYPNLRYQIIGEGIEGKKLRNLTKELGLESNVEFLGRLPHHQVMKYMASCDVFTLPSWNEGFGVVYLEAMATGKPVIGCEGQGVEDFVESGTTGILVKPRDVDSLVEALAFLLGHSEEARIMAERARERVLERFTWEKNAATMIGIYEEVLSAG
jgi:glycosyltransferase involved in cell wall biosynthesis